MADRPDGAVRPAPLQELAAKVKKVERSSLAWRPVWSRPAVMRALRAVLVIPAVFALTYEGFGNLQIALFAAFGGFASLIVASFGGSRQDKLIAHLGLAVTGSIALIIGTAVSGSEWLGPGGGSVRELSGSSLVSTMGPAARFFSRQTGNPATGQQGPGPVASRWPSRWRPSRLRSPAAGRRAQRA